MEVERREADPMPEAGLSPQAAKERDLASSSAASSEALRELAFALRSSVETMHGVRDLQAEMVKTLKRQDRSEMVLQSTQALNDTFRNLATIQRELLTRLETAQKPAKGMGRLIPLMLLGLLVVFLGGVVVVLDVLDSMREDQGSYRAAATGESERTFAAYREGKQEAEEQADGALARLQEQLERSEGRVRAVQDELDGATGSRAELEGNLRRIEAEREDLASQVRAAQNEMLARRALEEEVKETTTTLALTEPRLRQLEIDLANARNENTDLRTRIGAVGLGRPDPGPSDPPAPLSPSPSLPAALPPAPSPAAPAVPTEDRVRGGENPPPRVNVLGADAPPAAAAPVASAVPPVPLRVDRDPMLLDKIRDRVNRMLEDAAVNRQDLWQVTRIDGVTTEHLEGVIALRYDRRTGRLLEQVEARELKFWVDRNQRRVEAEFHGGRRSQGGAYQGLPGTGLRQVVANGEMSRVWSQSGLGFLLYR